MLVALRLLFDKTLHRLRGGTWQVGLASVGNLLANLVLLALVLILFLNMLIAGYVTRVFEDVESGAVNLAALSDEDYIDFAEVVCYLVDLNGGAGRRIQPEIYLGRRAF